MEGLPPPPAGFEVQAQPATPKRHASGVLDALQAGYQGSATGLAVRGKLPDVVLDPQYSTWVERLSAGAAQMGSEIPEMVLGAMGGSMAGGAGGTAVAGPIGTAVGGVVGAGAGAFALPAAIRESLMQAYAAGEADSSGDFLSRAGIVLKKTGKEALIGGLTFGAGGIAARTAGKAIAPAIGEAVSVPVAKSAINTSQAAAEIGTMVVTPALLEGKLPEPEDFLNAAILLGGAKGAVAVASRLRATYAQTGVRPEQVVADAASDPAVREEMTKPVADETQWLAEQGFVPKAYRGQANAEVARAAVPEPGPKARAFTETPYAKIPQEPGAPKVDLNVNYDYINDPAEIGPVLARASELYGENIAKQTRGKVSWEQTEAEQAERLAGMVGAADASMVTPRLPGEGATAVELGIRTAMMEGAAADFTRKAQEYDAATATAEQKIAFLASAERVAMLSANFQGAASEVGRALQYLQNARRGRMQADQIKTLLDSYGKDPDVLAEMAKQIDTPEGAARFAREAVKATTWEKIVEAWKAGLLSGPVTHMRNVLGNTSFLATRPVIDAAASVFGLMRGSPAERVTMMEPVARVIGNLQGTVDGAKYAWEILKTGEVQFSKAEQYRKAIGGTVGEVIRAPFRALSAADAFFKTLNERGEVYSLAVRQATAEGLNPATREFQTRVVELVENPTTKMAEAIEQAGLRFTFNTPLGEKGQALQNLVRKAHLEWAMPFIRTPGNILKETARLTPLSPLVGEWRTAIAEKGAKRDQAIAELATGTAFMSAIVMSALNGNISGAGDPDPGKRRVAQAAGWQPYSIKVGDKWYSYQGIGPVTTLIGIAADMATVWDHMGSEESDKIPKILAVAFANAVTSQTALMGLTNIVNITSDPTRYGPTFFKSMAGTVVPAIVAQPTAMADPVVRQVDSMLDAIKARIPVARQTLLPKRDVFGEPIQSKDRMLDVSPITTTTESTDKVRTEAGRLGISAAGAPKKTHVGKGTGKLGDVKLEPEQANVFQDVAGHLAHDIMAPLVASPAWDALPDIIKKRAYAKAFLQAHRAGAAAALPTELRNGVIQEITQRMAVELQPAEVE